MLTEEKKTEIAKVLNSRLGQFQCPMCHRGPFSILDGYIVEPINDNYKTATIGGSAIPMVAIVCSNCGFVSYHALGAIGLLENSSISNSQASDKEPNSDFSDNSD